MLAALLVACTGGPSADTAAEACADAPVVTWESFGQSLLVENCQSCHASTALDRHGAPESVTFDTEADALAQKERILVVSEPELGSMPPSLPLTDDDYALLTAWLTCYADE